MNNCLNSYAGFKAAFSFDPLGIHFLEVGEAVVRRNDDDVYVSRIFSVYVQIYFLSTIYCSGVGSAAPRSTKFVGGATA